MTALSPPHALLLELTERGVELWRSGDRLRFRPLEAVTPDLRGRLRDHKPELLRLLAPRRFGPDRPDLPGLLALRAAFEEAGRLPRALPALSCWAREERPALARAELGAARRLARRLRPGSSLGATGRAGRTWARRVQAIEEAAREARAELRLPTAAEWIAAYPSELVEVLFAFAESELVEVAPPTSQIRDAFTGRVLATFGGEVVPEAEAARLRAASAPLGFEAPA